MSDKTCESCKWWSREYERDGEVDTYPDPNDGECRLNEDRHDTDGPLVWVDGYEQNPMTNRHFGCNQWEEKEAGNSPDD